MSRSDSSKPEAPNEQSDRSRGAPASATSGPADLRLWHAWACPFSMRVRILLREKGLAWESEPVALDDLPEAVTARVEEGSVPMLERGDLVLADSWIIAEYLEELGRGTPLMPRGAEDRARVRLELAHCEGRVAPAAQVLEHQLLSEEERHDPQRRMEARMGLKAELKRLAEKIRGPFIFGELSLADVFYAPWLVELDALELGEADVPRAVRGLVGQLERRPSIAEEATLRRQAVVHGPPRGER